MSVAPKTTHHTVNPHHHAAKPPVHHTPRLQLNYAVELERDAVLDAVHHSSQGMVLPNSLFGAGEQDYDGYAIGSSSLAGCWTDRMLKFPTAFNAQMFLADHGFNGAQQPSSVSQYLLLWGHELLDTMDGKAVSAVAQQLASGQLWCVPLYPVQLSNPGLRSRQHFEQKQQTNVVTSPAICAGINAALGTNIDFKFISEEEGGQWQRGYIPYRRKAAAVVQGSGVTIGSGFDLGQQTRPGLIKMGFNEYFLDQFGLYVHVPMPHLNHDGVCTLIRATGPMPVLATPALADELDRIVFTHYVGEVRSAWNNNIGPNVKTFNALSSAWQTATLDYLYQNGRGGFIGSTFGRNALAGDKTAAINALRGMNDPRRTAEANLLSADNTEITNPPPPKKPDTAKPATPPAKT